MKKILLLAFPLFVMCFASCEKDKKEWIDDSPVIQFKDPKFLEAIVDLEYDDVILDKNHDGQISEKEASVFERLECSEADIRNMEEIKYFTSLKRLDCHGNGLTSLDLSSNTALAELKCSYNNLASLDLSSNAALTVLNCSGNELSSLDVNECPALTELICENNPITSLDVSKSKKIEILRCVYFFWKDKELILTEDTKCPLESLKIYKNHIIRDDYMSVLEKVYENIIEYVE